MLCCLPRYYSQLCAEQERQLAAGVNLDVWGTVNVNCTVLDGSVDAIWSLARDDASNLFAANWAGPPPTPGKPALVNLAQDSSAVMSLLIYAKSGR